MAVKILGIGTSLGNRKIPESTICAMAGKEPGYLKVRTELQQVFYIEKNQGNMEDVFVDSILNALIDARLTLDDIDGVFVSHSGVHGDKVLSLSSKLVTRLGLNTKKHVIAKDINAACVGFGDALDTAVQQLINDGTRNHKNYIVVAGDDLGSGQRDLSDIKTGMFSDGAGCMIISNNPNYHSTMDIKRTASGMSNNVNPSNVQAISQHEGEYLTMHDGRALSESLLQTADEIFSLLNIKKLDNNTVIIPHQPNGKMITKWGNASKIITKARETGSHIEVHNETYKDMGNLSGASVLFALQNIIKKGMLPKGCKHIILAPFGAGGHLAGVDIVYHQPKNFLPFISWDQIHKEAEQFANNANDVLFGTNAPISYKKNTSGKMVSDLRSEFGLSWFLPQRIALDKYIATIDVFHWQILKSLHPDKEFVTKNISYELPKSELDENRITTFDANNQTLSGSLHVSSVDKIGQTRSGKDIYQVITTKDGVKVASEFCEIPTVDTSALLPMRDLSENQAGVSRVIETDRVNIHGSIGGYVSALVLLEKEIPQAATIEFVGGGKYGEEVSIMHMADVDPSVKGAKAYASCVPTDLCIVNKDTNALVAVLRSGTSCADKCESEYHRTDTFKNTIAAGPIG